MTADDEKRLESWNEYRKLVLMQLETLQVSADSVVVRLEQYRVSNEKDLADIRIELALLKFKTSVWSGIIGAVSAAIITIGALLLRLTH